MDVPFAELGTQIGRALARQSGTAPGKAWVNKHHHLVRQIRRDVFDQGALGGKQRARDDPQHSAAMKVVGMHAVVF
jgi:hypothetical protein